MPRTLAYVTPAVLKWARESAGYGDVTDAADLIHVDRWRLEAAEEGVDYLTLREAERAAKLYERSLATLFLAEPPEEEPVEAQFRRLAGAPSLPWEPEMHLLVRRIADRQRAAAELLDLLDEPPTWPDTARTVQRVPLDRLDAAARQMLGPIELADVHDNFAPLRWWIDAIEARGVLVMQDGSMPVATMRGFASPHPTVPIIVVNTKDDPRSRAFTVVHEFGHLLRKAAGIADDDDVEPWCEDFAGCVIAPPERLRDLLSQAPATASTIGRIDWAARQLGLTPLAAAVRIAHYELLPDDEARRAILAIRQRPGRVAGRGGDYYRNQIAWFGPAYIGLVLDALRGGAVTYPTASDLLGGVAAGNLGTLRERLDSRTEAA